MSIFDKLSFINETISVNGQPVNDDDSPDDVSPDYTGDNPEDEPSDDPNRDAPPATPDPPAPEEGDTPPEGGDAAPAPEPTEGGEDTADAPAEGEEEAPDYSTDSPEGDDAGGEEAPEAGDAPMAATAVAPEGDAGAGEDEAPDYSADSPEGGDEGETPDAGGDAAPDAGGGEDEAPDYSADSPEAGGDETPAADTGGDAPAAADAGGGEGEAPDYSADSPEGGGDAEGGAPDAGGGEGGEGEEEGEEGAEGGEEGTDPEVADAGEADEIDQLQKDVFADMTPAQIAIKDKEQKTQFITLFSDIASALERLNLVGRNSENMRTIEFVTRKFLELKDQVKDYLVYTYDNESYTKNTFNLNKFIAIYASLIELIENMVEEKKKLEGEMKTTTTTAESAFQEFFDFAGYLTQDIGTKYRYASITRSVG